MTELLERAYLTTGATLRAIDAHRLAAPSPCTGWTVGEVAGHLADAHDIFARVLEGDDVDFADPGGAHDADPAVAYGERTERCLAALAAPGVLERVFPFAFGPAPGALIAQISLSETLIHGWDVARGAGVGYEPDPAVVEAVADFQSQSSGDDPAREGMFAPPVPAPDDASPLVRLLAHLGRRA
ncbi:TIGR03086 family metal-binding protein [Prauserella muralis]|uniref:TIGR03086 family protein n=2 Tax=Prauserella muralis TaxID=588067 RepID=A0A2V4ALQ0_9PSEU|nr:TIGR03086 family metal-binding protein [Prauserella muralis]PXY21177.1 TIGR03086 family protein [Prauserella muralis]TWE30273.1 uncharacterized protein (TIGR03086 family) [Prauserella muralis]